MVGLWLRTRGHRVVARRKLLADLKQVTHSGSTEISDAVLSAITEASVNEDSWLDIIRHLHDCLTHTGRHWPRIYGGLVLAEALAKSGSPALTMECGPVDLSIDHVDLVRILALLETFESDDSRVTNSIRRRAEVLHKELVLLRDEYWSENVSICSPTAASTMTGSATISNSGDLTLGQSDDFASDSDESDGMAQLRCRHHDRIKSAASFLDPDNAFLIEFYTPEGVAEVCFSKKRFAMSFLSYMPLVITKVLSGGHAEELGVKVGWQIKSIAGADVSQLKYAEALELIQNGSNSMP